MSFTQVATMPLAMLFTLIGSASVTVATTGPTIEEGWSANHVMRSEKKTRQRAHLHQSSLEVTSDGQPSVIDEHGALLESAAAANRTVASGHVPCDFLESTGTTDVQCADKSFCNPETHAAGWGCCDETGGRRKCPVQFPLMCSSKKCSGDHCCEKSCDNHGGLRKCVKCDETLAGFRDDAYRGCQTVTRTGKKCQRWDSQTPHAHHMTPAKNPLKDLRENYCRNPDGRLSIWCFTEEKGTNYEFCDPVQQAASLIDGPPRCSVPLPLVGRRSHPYLPNSKIEGSSYISNLGTSGKEEMWRSRIENIGSTWTAEISDPEPWIQWDFGTPRMIHMIQTKGRADCCAEWVTSYKVAYSSYGDSWTMLDPVYDANHDKDSVAENTIDPPIVASMLRLFPVAFHEKVSLRAEIFGCSAPAKLATIYHNTECCSGNSCDESVEQLEHASWKKCYDACKAKGTKCKGFQFGKHNKDAEFDKCSGTDLCSCWLITGECTKRSVNRLYDAFMLEAPTTPMRIIGFDGQPGSWKGRVELERNNNWGTVCSDLFTDEAAKVVCRQLGLQGGKMMPSDQYAKGIGAIWMDKVQCKGDESKLWRCKFAGWGRHNCKHTSDVGVECDNPAGVSREGKPPVAKKR